MKRFGHSMTVASAMLLTPVLGLGQEKPSLPGGELQILDQGGTPVGACPLKHTVVEADIVGFVAHVTVRQVFHNPTNQKIEAVYVFPLPQDAAVDDMVMLVGDRRIVAEMKEREEARRVYEAARAAGHIASLLDQERPNIFTQAVANIEPGVEVAIEISYIETLKYEDGRFEWVFPMVVGPRYIPGHPLLKVPPVPLEQQGKVSGLDASQHPQEPYEPKGTGWSPDTDRVPDASRITPPVVKPGYRAGHDISLTVTIDAGLPIVDLGSVLHQIAVQRLDGRAESPVRVTLPNLAEIPNRDFILHYRLGTEQIGDALLVHQDQRGQFFTLILQPPQRVVPAQLVPRELIFVLDTSGSMSGFPIEKAKEVMSRLIGSMRPADTFNVITFSGDTRILWNLPRPATPANVAEAQQFLASRHGGGGTEMMKAINAALTPTPVLRDPGVMSLRIACFLTDGYVGNDMEIIGAVKRNAGTTRVFSCGIGNSVNRFLLDSMAAAGRGEVEYVTLQSDVEAAVQRLHERILAPVLTDIQIDWGELPVTEVYPAHIPDLFSAKPIMVHGRLTSPASGTVTLRGNTGAGPFEQLVQLQWPQRPPDHAALPSLWARAKVADLMMQDYGALQTGQFPADLKRQVIALGLEYRLVTQFTSFVAVEELTVTVGGQPTKITVPVEMPDGVSYEGVFGEGQPGLMQYCRVAAVGAPAQRGLMQGAEFKSLGSPPPIGGGMFGQGARRIAPAQPTSLTPQPSHHVAREEEADGLKE